MHRDEGTRVLMGRDIILRDCAFSPESLGTCIAAVNEPKRSECGAPDYLVSKRDYWEYPLV